MKLIILMGSFFYFLMPIPTSNIQKDSMYTGAWQNKTDSGETICLIDGYFIYSRFNEENKTFHQTWGGPYMVNGQELKIKVEFDSKDAQQVGKEKMMTLEKMKQVDDGSGILAGNWRIIKRKQGEEMTDLPLRPRRTLKLLTSSRFQWMAINIETGEFSGTGGGTYNFENGKYTEHIEFFSRDGNRVGASLEFDGKVENGDWHHSGLSSKGEPIYEIWSRMKPEAVSKK